MAKAAFDNIYTALESNQYDVALQLCSKPEMAKYTLTHALHAYTLASTRKYGQALELARKINSMKSDDEGVVNALCCTFKLCKTADADLALCYEQAMATGIMNKIHNHMELFVAYARLQAPKKMQAIAQKMYKLSDEGKYLYWVANCMLMQPDLPKAMLGVAEKMVWKLLYESSAKTRQPGAEELHLYLNILVIQGKLEAALAALRELRARPAGPVIEDGEHYKENTNLVAQQPFQLNLMEIDLLRSLGSSAEVHAACKRILASYPDQWDLHTLCIAAVQGPMLAELSLQCSLSCLLGYIERFHSKSICFMDIKPVLYALHRQGGDLMAVIAYCMQQRDRVLASIVERMAVKADDIAQVEALAVAVEAVQLEADDAAKAEEEQDDEPASASTFTSTASKKKRKNKKTKKAAKAEAPPAATGAAAATPAEPAIKPIHSEELAAKASKDADLVVMLAAFGQLETILFYCHHLLGSGYYTPEIIAERLVLYQQTLAIFHNGVGGENRTLQPADDLLILISEYHNQQMMRAVTPEEHTAAAMEYAAFLQYAMSMSAYNYKLKLDLLRVCGILGDGPTALGVWNNLGAKHIQNDSMSYLLLPMFMSTANFSMASKQCKAILLCQQLSRRESADMLGHAFEYGNYNKVLELEDFGKHSNRSMALALARVEAGLLELLERHYSLPEVMKYLQELSSDVMVSEQVPHLSQSQLAALISHNDYALLDRVTSTPEEVSAAAGTQNPSLDSQILARLATSQGVFLIVQAIVSRNWDTALQLLTEQQEEDEEVLVLRHTAQSVLALHVNLSSSPKQQDMKNPLWVLLEMWDFAQKFSADKLIKTLLLVLGPMSLLLQSLSEPMAAAAWNQQQGEEEQLLQSSARAVVQDLDIQILRSSVDSQTSKAPDLGDLAAAAAALQQIHTRTAASFSSSPLLPCVASYFGLLILFGRLLGCAREAIARYPDIQIPRSDVSGDLGVWRAKVDEGMRTAHEKTHVRLAEVAGDIGRVVKQAVMKMSSYKQQPQAKK